MLAHVGTIFGFVVLVFTINGTMINKTSVDVFIDGVKQFDKEYSVNLTNSTITFTAAPGSGTLIEVTGLRLVVLLTGDARQDPQGLAAHTALEQLFAGEVPAFMRREELDQAA